MLVDSESKEFTILFVCNLCMSLPLAVRIACPASLDHHVPHDAPYLPHAVVYWFQSLKDGLVPSTTDIHVLLYYLCETLLDRHLL